MIHLGKVRLETRHMVRAPMALPLKRSGSTNIVLHRSWMLLISRTPLSS